MANLSAKVPANAAATAAALAAKAATATLASTTPGLGRDTIKSAPLANVLTGSEALSDRVNTREGHIYDVADPSATDQDLTTAGGRKLYAVPRDDRLSLGALGVDFEDTSSDQSAVMQNALGVLARRGYIGLLPARRIRCDKLWLRYHPVYAPDMPTILTARWGLMGAWSPGSSNIKNDSLYGTQIYSALGSQIVSISGVDTPAPPFLARAHEGDSNPFIGRGLRLDEILFEGATDEDVHVLELSQQQSFVIGRLGIKQKGDGRGLKFVDNDQFRIDEILCNGHRNGGAGRAPGRAADVSWEDIDASNFAWGAMLVEGWGEAGVFAGSASDRTLRGRIGTFNRINCQDCTQGYTLQYLEALDFVACQMRGDEYGLKLLGQLYNMTIGGQFIAENPTDGTAHAGIIIGTPATSATDRFYGVHIRRPDLKVVIGDDGSGDFEKSAILWHAGIGRDGVHIENPSCYFEAGGSASLRTPDHLIRFTNVPGGGGRVTNPFFSGPGSQTAPTAFPIRTNIIASNVDWQYNIGHFDFGNLSVSNRVHGRNQEGLFGNGSSIAAADNTLLEMAETHTITGNTAINTLTVLNRATLKEGDTLILYFTGTPTLKSTIGGGTGTGNLALTGGDMAVAAGTVLTLRYFGGKLRLVS